MHDISGVNYSCQDTFEGNISLTVAYLFIILLHQFLICPCFRKYIPSMLKRIGLGMVLIVIANKNYYYSYYISIYW